MNKCLVIVRSEAEFSQIKAYLNTLFPGLYTILRATSFNDIIADPGKYLPSTLILSDTDTVSLTNLQKLNTISPYPSSIIVISPNMEDAVKCYDTGIVTDFILKPIEENRLFSALSRALRNNLQIASEFNYNFIFLKKGRSFSRFSFDEIIYIEGFGAKVKIYSEKGVDILNDSIANIHKRLNVNLFFKRVHKSFIINTQKVVAINPTHFVFSIGNVPVGRTYRHELEDFFNSTVVE